MKYDFIIVHKRKKWMEKKEKKRTPIIKILSN